MCYVIANMVIVCGILCLIPGILASNEFEPVPYDGWYNNLLHPDWGAADTQLLRRSKTAYTDHVYHPSGPDRPNPLEVSRAAHHGPAGQGSYYGRTAMLVYFGQQVVEEIVDSQRAGCPIEYFNIPVPDGHPQFDPGAKGNVEMTFKRSRYDQHTGFSPNNPRQQLNEITPYLDGQVIYGPNKAWTDAIRSLKGGRLAGSNPGSIQFEFPPDNNIRLPFANPPVAREHVLKPVSRFQAIGNPRGHENPFLLSLGILWFRWHNLMADRVRQENDTLNDEQIFNIARKRTIAVYQKLVFYDWLPTWLDARTSPQAFRAKYPYKSNGGGAPYNGYDPSVHPGIYQEFQSAAMRFGHTLVPPGLWRRTAACTFLRSPGPLPHQQYAALRLCNAYWDSRKSVEEDLDALFRGMATTIAEREDSILVPDLTESLFGPLEFSRRDLAALNIQRGRDHGLPDYNTVRTAYGLEPISSWLHISPTNHTREHIKALRKLYRKTWPGIRRPDNVDLFTGGMLETTPAGPGELFQKIILDQFLRIRHGDRFWFENTEHSGLTQAELNEVWATDFIDVVTTVTGVRVDEVQNDLFLFRNEDDIGCQKQPQQLDPTTQFEGVDMLEACTPLQHYDYFTGSEVSYALTFVVLGLVILVLEWIDSVSLERIVRVVLDAKDDVINVYDSQRVLLRYIDVKTTAGKQDMEIHVSSDRSENTLIFKLTEYDLVIKFYSQVERDRFLTTLEQTFRGVQVRRRSLMESYMLNHAVTRQHRQEKLNRFFKKILSMFKEGETDVEENIYADDSTAELRRIELTQAEFGEAFGMRANSTFVKHMFLLVDANKSGHVSFKEFMDIFILLSSDNADNKIRLLFNMYDLKGQGYLTRDDLHNMVRSLLDLSENNVTEAKVSEFTQAMYKSAGLREGAEITYSNFKKVFGTSDYAKTLKKATIELDADYGEAVDQAARTPANNPKMLQRRATLYNGYSTLGASIERGTYRDRYPSVASAQGFATLSRGTLPSSSSRLAIFTDVERKAPVGLLMELYEAILGYLETFKLQVFWMTLYLLVTAGVFIERSYYYAVERENGGLRRVTGHGVTMSRGSASVIMFTYACLLVTMCKNLITYLRETFLHRFIPFDSLHYMHKFIACLSLAFTVLHVITHGVNLYHICTQPSTDLNCYFREYFRATHELATFHYWAFNTTTGLSGVILTVLLVVLYVFSLPFARRYLFHSFWNTHKLYILVYLFLLIHGSARLVQEPHFPYYLVGPAILFTIDKLISKSRMKIPLTVVKAVLLPSDVIALKVRKPEGFEYKSGQWAQVACTSLGSMEFHPFTMTSAPHEKHVTFHIRAVGPWTRNLRQVYDPSNNIRKALPKLLLDGPFGEGHQDWYRYEVSVLIGGGIGVTPFASILKDIVHKSSMDINMQCKKIYFLWVTRTQKQFEWVTDIIRDVEASDVSNFVTTHIFVTEIRTKFDLRTSMLYICERHFQKIAGKSLFTGLEAITHFGRPRFHHFLESLRYEHENVKRLGVFSCGPRPMTLAVESACARLNKVARPTYFHHYENF